MRENKEDIYRNYVNQELLSKFLNLFEEESIIARAIDLINLQYSLNIDVPNKKMMLLQCVKLKQKIKLDKNEEIQQVDGFGIQNWLPGQLQLFYWITILYCFHHSLSLSIITAQHIQELSTIFIMKSVSMLKFQINCLLFGKINIRENWQNQEEILLVEIVKKYPVQSKWKETAFRLFIQSNFTYFRTPKQCRQKWINHLNPNIIKSAWTHKQDIYLFELMLQMDVKWSQISKAMKGFRNEHMVKNRAKSLIKKYLKKIPRIIRSAHIQDVYRIMIQTYRQQDKKMLKSARISHIQKQQFQLPQVKKLEQLAHICQKNEEQFHSNQLFNICQIDQFISNPICQFYEDQMEVNFNDDPIFVIEVNPNYQNQGWMDVLGERNSIDWITY